MTPLQQLLHRMKQHKDNGKKVLSVDYVIQTIENDIAIEASKRPQEAR
jgi:hypothetical protein